MPPSTGKLVATKVKPTNLLADDIIIAVMGPTGAGKSRFIDIATQQAHTANVGHSLESCTSEVRAVRFQRTDGNGTRSYVIVDTPGFDDTNKPDTVILALIANWLKTTYKQAVHLAGIIYLHRISDNRMAGSPLKNLRMFAKLCGDDPLRNVILATTMWDRVDKSKGEERQRELEGKYWKDMRDHGSQTRRFGGSFDSAWNIIDAIPKKTIGILLLQEELVDLKRQLSETQAGIALYNQLQKLLAEHKETLRKLREEAVGNNDEQLTKALNAEYDTVQRKLQGTFEQVAGLKLSWIRRIALLFGRRSQITSNTRVG